MNSNVVQAASMTETSIDERLEAIRRDLSRDVWCVLGLPFDATTEAATCEHLLHCIETRQKCFFTTPNLNFAITASRDEAFRQSVIDSDWVVADGMPLIWVAKKLGIPLTERVAGSSVFEALRQGYAQQQKKLRVVFFGGPDGVAAEAFKKIATEDSAMEVVGFYSPGFGSVEEMSPQHVIDQINESEADMVVVALGAKRGQAWIDYNQDRLNAPVLTHLGAVVNFVAGTVARAPLWMQKSGLEWVWRIWEERSLLQRYWADGMAFLRLLRTSVGPYSRLIKEEAAQFTAQETHTAEIRDDVAYLKLNGTYLHTNLDALRETLATVIRNNCEIELDCSGVDYADSAMLGLLLVAKKRLVLNHKQIRITSCSPLLSRILRYNGLDSELDALT